jgi:hemerythrin-like domain-containing protein
LARFQGSPATSPPKGAEQPTERGHHVCSHCEMAGNLGKSHGITQHPPIAGETMDALSLLKKDHQEVKSLFKEVEELGDRATSSRAKLFTKIDEALTLHAKLEEQLFYPELKKRAPNNEEREKVLEAFEEHAIVKTLLGELEELDPKDETYRAKLQVLTESVEHHIKEEESDIFKLARQVLDADELESIGEGMLREKEAAGVA